MKRLRWPDLMNWLENRVAMAKLDLLVHLCRQDIVSKHHGTALGALWVLATPVLMLIVYSWVFGSILTPKWPGSNAAADFVVNLQIGLIVLLFFSEVISRAPTAVTTRPNFVKKVVFPLHFLPIIPLVSAVVTAVFGLVLLACLLVHAGSNLLTLVTWPYWLGPTLVYATAAAFFLAALGVFFKDIAQITAVAMTAMTFLSPIFYPVSAVPEKWQGWFWLNPLATSIEGMRAHASNGAAPHDAHLVHLIVSPILLALGVALYRRLSPQFADSL
jgi:lipopolysaccharide transport system permease protein